MRLILIALLTLALAGCAATPEATVVIDDTAHSGGSALAVDPSSSRVVSGGWEGWLQVWRITDGAPLAGWKAHDGTVNGTAFLTENLILSAGYDGALATWEPDGRKIASRGAGSPVTAFGISADRSVFVTGHADGYVRWWKTDGLMPLRQDHVHEGAEVLAAAMHPSGTMAASSDDDGRVALIWPDGRHRWLDAPPTDALTLTFAKEGGTLFGAGWFAVYRWDSAGDEVNVLPTDHRGEIKSITFTTDGRQIASISRQTDSHILLLDPATGRTNQAVGKHDLCGGVVTLSPNGRFIVSTSDDATVRIWDRKDPRVVPPAAPVSTPGAW
jgi:WD40 repeat protein